MTDVRFAGAIEDDFPSTRERLEEAEQLLLEGGRMQRAADLRAVAAEKRAAEAEARLAALIAKRS